MRSQVAARSARGMAGDIDVEADIFRIGAGCAHRAEVRFAHVDCTVPGLLQQHGQGHGVNRVANASDGTEPVDIPRRQLQGRVLGVIRAVLTQGPVRHAMPGGVETGHQADARR